MGHTSVFNGRVFAIIFCSFLLTPFFFSDDVLAHQTSITTSGSINFDIKAFGDRTYVVADDITVDTTCHAGYDLTISTSVSDNNLYFDGDASNNTAGTFFAPSDGENTLNDSPETWGYLLSDSVPGASSVFAAVPTLGNQVFIKTASQTASTSDIHDAFSVYFGASVSHNLQGGTYKLIPDGDNQDGGVIYTLTPDLSCAIGLDISFDKNAGTDVVDNFPDSTDVVVGDGAVTLPSNRPTRSGYIFKEWNTEPDGSGSYFAVGDTIIVGQDGLNGAVTLYAIWVQNCAANTICYNANHADAGTMPDQGATSNTDNNLTPSNFSRAGYGFAGWNTEADGTGTSYGPGQTINPGNLSTTGLTLFANWIEPTGTLQTWAGASNMNVGDVIALRDNRDNEVYAVAKLTNDNVWIIENLRLIPASANITDRNTNGPTTTFLNNYTSSASSDMCSSDNATCDDSVQFNANNLNRSLTASPTNNDNASSWYSYGVMYNWYTATAGNGTYSKTSGSVTGDLCPSGWHMPTSTSSGEWNALNTAINNGYTNKDPGLRTYPANFIWSGDYNPSNVGGTGRGTQARYWSTTAKDAKNAYRMGFAASTVTATSNGWNKWDGFAIRCIYQGGNIPYADVDVEFDGTGITSVLFENNNYPTETATPSSPTVSLAEGVSYTVTAITSAGYELTNWATTANGTLSSTTTNPTTYAISEEATLTVTGTEIPSYTVTVNLGEHVTGISFINATYGTESLTPASAYCTDNNNGTYTCSVSLRRGIEYNLTSSYEAGYTIDEWTTSANGTLGSTTTASTTYIITGTTTLSISAQETDELSYTLIYDAGLGTDAPDSETEISYNSTYDFTITDSAPIYYGYTFIGWTETSGGSTIDYVSGDTLTVTSAGAETTKTLYAIYTANSCPSGKICYYDNGADVNRGGRGTMTNQSASSNASVNLIPSNYSKSGYGFAGWTTDANATPYGPNATITTPDISSTGLALYAKWVKSTGELQTWSGCGTLTLNNVTALTDIRDNNTYAVTKLADDNCWLMENLRLDPGTANITSQNTNNPTSTFITQSNAGSGSSLSANTLCNSNDSTCFDQIQYNSNSANRSLNQSHTANTNSTAWYSYGTYYNWYTATAGQGTYSTTNNTTVSGDICPKKWRIPTGNSTGEYNALNAAVNSGSTSSDAGLRAYPVNLLWSGDYNNTKRNSSYSNGRIWTATAKDNDTAYRVGFASNTVTASTNTYNKWDGFVVRCIYDFNAIDYYDVTVTFPANVTSVSFTSVNYGIQTAIPSNTTVSLAQGATYTITATFANGYTLDTWTNGANSTIGSTSANPTTFSITDDSTLTLAATTLSCNPSATTIGTAVCMQDINEDIISSMTTNTQYQLYDMRDWKQYYVAKLVDGNVWMTQNLDFDIDSTKTYTSVDTNIPSGTTWTPMRSTYAAGDSTWIGTYNNNDTPESYDPGEKIWDGMPLNHSYPYLDFNTMGQGTNPHYHIGNYYNWAAAIASNDSSVYTNQQITNQSICPAGWTLPWDNYYSVTSGSLGYLIEKANLTAGESGNIHQPPYYFVYGGFYTDGAGIMVDQSSWYWTSVSNGNREATVAGSESWGQCEGCDHYATSVGRHSGQTVRCIADVPSHIITVNLGAHVSSVSFYNADYGTQEITLDGGSVKLLDNVQYTISSTHELGYEIGSWSTTTNGTLGSTTTNPTTYTITGATTLAVTSQVIPTYTVTVNMDSHVTGITFTNADYGTQSVTATGSTVTLRRGVPYVVTASIEGGYTVASWSTAANGTLDSATDNPTIYTISDTSTLTLASETMCGTTAYPGTICYDRNDTANGTLAGTMGRQPVDSSATSIKLLASNFSNSDYGFAGWSTTKINPDSPTFRSDLESATIYGPQENITFTAGQYSSPNNGLKLYAVWVPVAEDTNNNKLTFQNTNLFSTTLSEGGNLNSKSNGYVTALKDQRDGQVYAVAKLNNNEYWMIENFRLEAENTRGNTNRALAHGYGGNFIGLADAESSWGSTSNSLYTTISQNTSKVRVSEDSFPRYNHANTAARATNPTSNAERLYSYGNYYSWAAATASTHLHSEQREVEEYSLCPTGWHLPSYERYSEDYFSITADTSSYPLNFVHAGYIHQTGSPGTMGSGGDYWTSTVVNSYSHTLFEAMNNIRKSGYSVRCVTRITPSVTVSLDPHISSVTFSRNDETAQTATSSSPTVHLKKDRSYTITATTDAGYKLASWSTTATGALDSTTVNPTVYTVSDTSTLSVTTTATDTGPIQPQAATSGCINYFANASDAAGTMGCQYVSPSATSATLLASNFSRTGYGFAGWSDAYDYATNPNANFYGPQETITFAAGQYRDPNPGLSLYAVWVPSNGSIQSWNGCSSLTQADQATNILTQSITALTDQRDNETYAVAKLADGKCWMIENLRLEASSSNDANLAHGFGGVFIGLADAELAWKTGNAFDDNSLYSKNGYTANTIPSGAWQMQRFPRYNNLNTSTRAINPTSSNANTSFFSYGNYYTWAAAMANTEDLTGNPASATASTSICPTGWHLPTGGNRTKIWNLIVGLNNGTVPTNAYFDTLYYTGSEEGALVSNLTRSYPNNFLYSGYVASGSVNNRSSNGVYWSSTADSGGSAYVLDLGSSDVYPGTRGNSKYIGGTVRCVAL